MTDAHYRRPPHLHFPQAANALSGQRPPAQLASMMSIHSNSKVQDEESAYFNREMLVEWSWVQEMMAKSSALRIKLK